LLLNIKEDIMYEKGGVNILNQVVLVGRIVKEPELHETSEGNKVSLITLAVPRSFKNSSGEYETDFISCSIWRGIAENVCEYCHKGDLIGVKGHIQSSSYEKDDVKVYKIEVIAEKVTFLSTKKADE